MALPELKNLNLTISGLHQGARLLGAVQQLTQKPQPAYLELALNIDPHGLSTGKLPSGGRTLLDFLSASLVYEVPGRAAVSFPLNGCTQAQVFDGLFSRLAHDEPGFALAPGADLFERVAAGIAGRQGRYQRPPRAKLMDETQIEIDSQTSRGYWCALQEIYTGIARFKARLRGMQTPLVVWPHGLDLSTLWFAGSEIDERQPHMNFGFSPRSEGIEYPYLYAYTYPDVEGYNPQTLPEGALWHSQGWKGMLLPYEVIAAQPDSAGFLEKSCGLFYDERRQSF